MFNKQSDSSARIMIADLHLHCAWFTASAASNIYPYHVSLPIVNYSQLGIGLPYLIANKK